MQLLELGSRSDRALDFDSPEEPFVSDTKVDGFLTKECREPSTMPDPVKGVVR